MTEIILHYRKENLEPGIPNLPGTFQLLYTNNYNLEVYSSGNKKEIYSVKHEHFDLYLIGNINFYRNFSPNVVNLFRDHQINKPELNRFLRTLNGIFCCLLIETSTGTVFIITDYLGFYPLYKYEDSKQIVMATELKHFRLFNTISCSIDNEAVHSYLYNGHLMLNQSWFQNIKRTRPASIYTLKLTHPILQQEYYWVWSRENKRTPDKSRTIETFAGLFRKGIEDLEISDAKGIGLSLSGGMESRWMAQVASGRYILEAFTFSTGKNYEAKLAERVAKELEIPHQQIEIPKENWLLNRLDAFWKTDGMMHLGHLHEAGIHSVTHASYSHCFHGFYGGGIYANEKNCIDHLNDETIKKHFVLGNSDSQVEDPFYQTGCLNPYTGDNKIRYQSAYSMYLLSNYSKLILPYYNMPWLQFNFDHSIDDAFRGYSELYLDVLNADLNRNLLDIPWQRTGIPPKYKFLNILSMKLKLPSILEAVAQKFKHSRHFINYNYFDVEIDFWIKQFKPDIDHLQMDYPLNSRERKLRILSLVIWLKMLSKNSPHVL